MIQPQNDPAITNPAENAADQSATNRSAPNGAGRPPCHQKDWVYVTVPQKAERVDSLAHYLKGHLGCLAMVSATGGLTVSCSEHREHPLLGKHPLPGKQGDPK